MQVIILGGGKTAYFLAKQFASKGYETAVVCQDAAEAKRLSRQLKATILQGDGSTPAMLEEAGARRAGVVVSLLPADEDSLIACQIARAMFGVNRTVALINDPANEPVFKQFGVTAAVSAAQILAQIIEQQTGFENILNLTPLSQGRISLTEILLTSDAPAIGQTLRSLGLPRDTLVAAVVRGDEIIVPRGDTRLALYDRVLLLTLPANHSTAIYTLVGEES